MPEYLSRKLKILSFLFIVMVLYAHSMQPESAGDPYWKIQSVFANRVGRIGLYGFFVISGFLLYYNAAFSWSVYREKLKKRFHGLVMPYLIYSGFLLAGAWLLVTFWPPGARLLGSAAACLDSPEAVLAALWYNPLAYHLWFVRDLFFLVILSPLYWLLLRRVPWLFAAGLIYMIGWRPFLLFPSQDVTLAFVIGMQLAQSKVLRSWISGGATRYPAINRGIFALWLLINGLTLNCQWIYQPLAFNALILLGVTACWLLYDVIPLNDEWLAAQFWIGNSFFIFLMHEPLMSLFKKLYLSAVPGYGLRLIGYFLIPLLILVILTAIALVWKKVNKTTYYILTGNR